VARAAAVVSSATLASRILGFLRDLIIARAFGASVATDAFFVAFRLPNLLRRLVAEGYRIEGVVNHASAIGCYFFDPEGNRTEVFWVTGRPCWVPTATPIDIGQPDETVLAEVDRVWNQLRHVPVGGRMNEESATVEVTRQP